jgi:hypothetical protein
MTPRRIFFAISLAALMFCLIAGYGLAGQWPGVVFAAIAGLGWLLGLKYLWGWLPHICLLVSVGLAVAGCLAGYSPALMIFGTGASLAGWDSLLLDASLRNSSAAVQTRRYETVHLQWLALAIGFGLTVVIVGRLLHVQFSFLTMLVSVTLITFGIDRVWGYLTAIASIFKS